MALVQVLNCLLQHQLIINLSRENNTSQLKQFVLFYFVLFFVNKYCINEN